MEESKFDSRQYSPFEVFMNSLYEYYREEIELDEAEKQPPGSSLVSLANFQEFAYKRDLQILDRYDGLLIADSVGLGKTWIGKKLLEHYGYSQRQNCLVVCPAQLRQMWEAELASATIPHRIITMEKLGQRDFDPLCSTPTRGARTTERWLQSYNRSSDATTWAVPLLAIRARSARTGRKRSRRVGDGGVCLS